MSAEPTKLAWCPCCAGWTARVGTGEEVDTFFGTPGLYAQVKMPPICAFCWGDLRAVAVQGFEVVRERIATMRETIARNTALRDAGQLGKVAA